ncbi:helix-turn-helix transcriptional regulator [Camelliibacillus cellulosilyticus]|uniref:Helix-turn-helix transcriptional regulator n=1 Tax=Camelliibacillus cellulosilyticus TaxID=2174486 RepID=A0ABV9GH74_9BACL
MKNRVKDFRKIYGFSQDRLAEALDVSRQTIISIEKGKYNPSLPLALRMAKLLNTSVEALFLLEDNE